MPRNLLDYGSSMTPRKRTIGDYLFDAGVIFGVLLVLVLITAVVLVVVTFGGR